MTEFRDWDESIVEEFLRVAEAAIRRDAPQLGGAGVDRDIAAVKGADYSAVQESLCNTVGHLQRVAADAMLEAEIAKVQADEQRRLSEAVAEECRRMDEKHLLEVRQLNELLIKRAKETAQVCNERDALVEAHDELAISLNLENQPVQYDPWDGSRFYEAE